MCMKIQMRIHNGSDEYEAVVALLLINPYNSIYHYALFMFDRVDHMMLIIDYTSYYTIAFCHTTQIIVGTFAFNSQFVKQISG